LGPCTEKIELGILIEEVSPRSTNIQSERVAFYLTSQLDFLCTMAVAATTTTWCVLAVTDGGREDAKIGGADSRL
jgi:hypothetical protein